ncbi:MAG TPA: NADH-quinone oxidoreductase subunit NuoF [Bacillota bacterium]|nr:NADH-quinone oxidoreductase subunit NuoF [Bacillota bacterium]HPF42561.1 NADH-quinone oxidoreductase subunit NuoF [Bacillota bacterium]HPQ62171.1 NADH-quinone oxidoreductase subunit NuoF [Bacillota bacterium]HRX91579.1 NADH-quinone oxidoreductase subunit NuoF [Candidatus Izemoplasmatales bacterium]
MLEMKLVSKRCGVIDPLSIKDYIDNGGYKALAKALADGKEKTISEIQASKVRGRGGAGFPLAIKISSVAKEIADVKYLVCNADEGEPGNFKDRYLMENDPHGMIEGMVIDAYLTGATKGYIYIRGEYQKAQKIVETALEAAKNANYLGKNICGAGFDFDLEIRSGAGSYVCGEEFALLESIEGKPGRSRVKPPFPTQKGLFGKPTQINNVETFATIPVIILMGGSEYQKIGTPTSTGTKLVSLCGNVRNKGVYEIPFGLSLREVIDKLGGGVDGGHKIRMVQLGGASGPIIPESMIDLSIDFDHFDVFSAKAGSGALIVIDERADMFEILQRIMEFFVHESCGKCTPCREGNLQLLKIINRFVEGKGRKSDLETLSILTNVMKNTSLCGLGQASPTAIISTMRYFPDEYEKRLAKDEM